MGRGGWGRAGAAAALVLAAGCLARAQDEAPKPGPAGEAPPTPPTPAEYIAQVLRAERLERAFAQVPLGEVLEALQAAVWLNVVLDGTIDRSTPVDWDPRGRALGEALPLLLGPLGLTHAVWCDVLFVHAADRPPPEAPARGPRGALARYTLQHAVTPFADAVDGLAHLARLPIQWTDRARAAAKGRTVTFRVRNLPLHMALTVLAHQAGLTWSERAGELWLQAPGERPPRPVDPWAEVRVSVRCRDPRPLPELLAILRGLTGVELRLDPSVPPDRTAPLVVDHAPLPAALDAIADHAGVRWRREGDAAVIFAP